MSCGTICPSDREYFSQSLLRATLPLMNARVRRRLNDAAHDELPPPCSISANAVALHLDRGSRRTTPPPLARLASTSNQIRTTLPPTTSKR